MYLSPQRQCSDESGRSLCRLAMAHTQQPQATNMEVSAMEMNLEPHSNGIVQHIDNGRVSGNK